MNFSASKFEYELINKIANRAVEIASKQGADYSKMTALMDIEACHCNGMPLKLDELLTATPFDFTHDVFGIANHIDRTTGKLTGCFVPRYSL